MARRHPTVQMCGSAWSSLTETASRIRRTITSGVMVRWPPTRRPLTVLSRCGPLPRAPTLTRPGIREFADDRVIVSRRHRLARRPWNRERQYLGDLRLCVPSRLERWFRVQLGSADDQLADTGPR